MLGQALLDRMELTNQELQLQSGEADVTRGLLALNVSQDYFESVLALHPGMMQDTVGTVTTTNNTETTAFPTGVLRIDRLQFIDPGTSRPSGPDLDNLGYAGSHTSQQSDYILAGSAGGRPRGYWTNGRLIYWSPLPDDTHTIRWYGLSAAADITAAGTFAYIDTVAFPLAAFASKLLTIGVGDSIADLDALAKAVFEPVILGMKQFNQDRSPGYDYAFSHTE
jgi:hypothetical protein